MSSSTNRTGYEAEAPHSSGTSMYEKLSAIDEILRGSSKEETKKILTMLASTRGLQVMVANRPLAAVAAPQTSKSGGAAKKASKAPSKAAWKSDPAWIAIQERHAAAVAAVRNAEEEAKAPLVDSLREIEVEIRALKQQFKGPKNF